MPVGEAAGPLLDLLLEAHEKMAVGDGSQAGIEMGPLVTSDHCQRVAGYIEKGVAEGAKPLVDGRRHKSGTGGFFLGPTIFDNVTPEMTIAKDEIFGPVLSVIRVKTLDDAIKLVNRSPFGNATSIFTSNGKSAREYSSRIEAGMVGINIGVAAPMAFFPFAGWKNSFLRRPARARQRRRRLLHRAESHHEPVVLSRIRPNRVKIRMWSVHNCLIWVFRSGRSGDGSGRPLSRGGGPHVFMFDSAFGRGLGFVGSNP